MSIVIINTVQIDSVSSLPLFLSVSASFCLSLIQFRFKWLYWHDIQCTYCQNKFLILKNNHINQENKEDIPIVLINTVQIDSFWLYFPPSLSLL